MTKDTLALYRAIDETNIRADLKDLLKAAVQLEQRDESTAAFLKLLKTNSEETIAD